MASNVLFEKRGFTIVELLVVIVVIGILAAISIVSYSGISNKAIAAGLQSDLDNNSKLLKMYNVEYGYYPDYPLNSNCPLTPTVNNRYCLKASTDTVLDYSGGAQAFTLKATKKSITYQVTDSSSPSSWQGLTGPDWVTIGTQTWATANLNVGTKINVSSNQTNNSTKEKYCYNNLESNCTAYGGLYLWDEAMQYVNTEGAQGLCPTGSHIPSDSDWKILEMHFGMTQDQADAIDPNRGTNQGTQIKSALNIGVYGYGVFSYPGYGYFNDLGLEGWFWSSSEYSLYPTTHALTRTLSSNAGVSRDYYVKSSYGFSVRCAGN